MRGTGAAQAVRQPAGWLRATLPGGPGPIDFHHGATRFDQPSPVGCFALGAAAHGVFDAAGNVWEWCANTADAPGMARAQVQVNDEIALRGGAFHDATLNCRPAYRNHDLPVNGNYDIGVRLVRLWLPHSAPRTPSPVT